MKGKRVVVAGEDRLESQITDTLESLPVIRRRGGHYGTVESDSLAVIRFRGQSESDPQAAVKTQNETGMVLLTWRDS